MNIFLRVLDVWKNEGVKGVSSRLRTRSRLALLKANELFGCKTVKSVYDLKFAANYSDITFRFYVMGNYGFYYWDRLSSINNPFVFLDIGANQGLYTICAAKNANSVMSYAFEPVAETFTYLKKNVGLNDVSNKCSLINKAIADRCGVATIATKAEHSGAATLADANDLTQAASDTDEIQLIDAHALENIVRAENYPIVVKIDVEGYEAVVIKQLLQTRFARQIKEIYFEVDEDWIDVNSIKTDLQNAGFDEFSNIGSGKHYDLLASKAAMAN